MKRPENKQELPGPYFIRIFFKGIVYTSRFRSDDCTVDGASSRQKDEIIHNLHHLHRLHNGFCIDEGYQ